MQWPLKQNWTLLLGVRRSSRVLPKAPGRWAATSVWWACVTLAPGAGLLLSSSCRGTQRGKASAVAGRSSGRGKQRQVSRSLHLHLPPPFKSHQTSSCPTRPQPPLCQTLNIWSPSEAVQVHHRPQKLSKTQLWITSMVKPLPKGSAWPALHS